MLNFVKYIPSPGIGISGQELSLAKPIRTTARPNKVTEAQRIIAHRGYCIYLSVFVSFTVLTAVNEFIIQISYTVRIPIFRLVDLYHVTLGYDETTSLTSFSWCNSRGVNSIHHCHYTMASADSKFDDFCLQCIQFE